MSLVLGGESNKRESFEIEIEIESESESSESNEHESFVSLFFVAHFFD
ncbi:MAG: hypothetical protein WCH11_06860 [Bdellovibrio sp.]